MNRPEAEVAVGRQGPHAELAGQGQSQAIVPFGLSGIRRIVERGDFAYEM